MHPKGIHTFTSLNLTTVNNLVRLLLKTEESINHQLIARGLLAHHLNNKDLAVLLIINLLHHPLGTSLVNKRAIPMQLNREILALGKAITRTELTSRINNLDLTNL